MNDLTTSVLDTGLGIASDAVAPIAAKRSNNVDFERLDLSNANHDKSLSIHQLAILPIERSEAIGHVRVFDFEHVYVHPTAKVAIKKAYITPLFLVEAFARNYRDSLLRKLTRGNDKGLLILNPEASTYVHRLSNGNELIVQGETVEVNGTYTRRLTISCRNELTQGVAA
jgi:hypothetical protein